MKVKKKKVRSPVPTYRYTKKKNTEKLPLLVEKKEKLENRIQWMSGRGISGIDRVQRSLDRVNEDIKDITSRYDLIISDHFRDRWHYRVCDTDTDQQIIDKLKEERIDNTARVLGSGAYPYYKFVVIINELVLTTILDPSVPKDPTGNNQVNTDNNGMDKE